MYNLADIIAQETQDGRLIVRFLVSAMEDLLPDFQPCHRIDAARLLVKLGFDQAQAQTVIDRARDAQRERTPNRDSRSQPKTRWLFESQSETEAEAEFQSAANSIRSQIVREETDHGRAAVRFLIDAMQGQFPDFKPGHRLSAAKELLQRGFDYLPDDPDAQADAEPEPEQMDRFLARYAEYLKQWNAEHPRNPIDINRFIWTNPTWRHLNNRPRAP